MMIQAQSTVQIDDEFAKVTEWRFPPGGATGFHRHELDYVVVPMTTGQLLIRDAAGERLTDLQAGQSYARNVGVEHDVINPNDFEFVFVEVEIRREKRGSDAAAG